MINPPTVPIETSIPTVGALFGFDRSVNWSASYEYKPYALYTIPVAILLGIIGAVVIVAEYLIKPKQVIPP